MNLYEFYYRQSLYYQGNKGAFRCPRCKKGFVTRYGYYVRGWPVCFRCWCDILSKSNRFYKLFFFDNVKKREIVYDRY